MELVVAGQDAEKLPGLEVAEAHDAQGLLGLVALGVEAVGWEVLDVCFGESPRLGLPQPLGQVQ